MSAKQSTTWFWSDWAGDLAVRRLTPAERGLWIDLLALAATGNPTGYVCDERGEPLAVEQIAHFANCSAAEASSLIDGILAEGVASRDRSGRLFNRRIVRDIELSVKRRRAGQAGGTATARKWKAFPGLPEHLPEQVPRQTRRAPYQERISNTFAGTARARAQESGSAKEGTSIPVTGSLAEVIAKKGWVS
jgi:hypothetical protein